MQEGGAFNTIAAPVPEDIVSDILTFQGWWSPGQYMAPGFFVWLGADYGLAMSLTTLFATLFGVIGWGHVARDFTVTPFILLLFLSGLVTFRYTTLAFPIYHGGEVLLFAVAPWSLYALQRALDKPPAACLVISLLTIVVLFFAKLTGLIVFAANVLTISALDVLRERRVRSSTLAMWAASAIGSLLFFVFWVPRGETLMSGQYALSWDAIWSPITSVALSGFSGLDLLSWLFRHLSVSIPEVDLEDYLLGPLGLLLIVWVWRQLRDTRYRPMAICLLLIITFYAIAIAALYVRQGSISVDDRHLRYAGILFFLLLLVAIDQCRASAKTLTFLFVIAFTTYGILSYAVKARELMQSRYYDSHSGISQQVVSPRVLEYLRSESAIHNADRPVVVLPALDAAIGLPRFRVIYIRLDVLSPAMIKSKKWAGRVDKIFIVVQQQMLANGKAEALLKSFVDYEFSKWNGIQLEGMVIYHQ
jgi:hypothetical protein